MASYMEHVQRALNKVTCLVSHMIDWSGGYLFTYFVIAPGFIKVPSGTAKFNFNNNSYSDLDHHIVISQQSTTTFYHANKLCISFVLNKFSMMSSHYKDHHGNNGSEMEQQDEEHLGQTQVQDGEGLQRPQQCIRTERSEAWGE